MADFGSSIVAYFGGDTTGLNRAIESAEGMVNKFQRALGSIGLTIGAGAVIGFFKSVTDKYGAIQDMSDALGVSTDAIQSFGYAAKQSGVSIEQTQKMWQTVRKSVDDLAAGTEMSVKQFAALGLTQKDLIGIPLDVALEKIAKAYVDNKDKAGAYAAMIEIAGGRSAKLMAVLEDLGVKGSKAFDDIARSSGQILGADGVKRIDDFGDRLEIFKGSLSSWGGAYLNALLKVGEVIGIISALSANASDFIKTDWKSIGEIMGFVNKKAQEVTQTMQASAAAQAKAVKTVTDAYDKTVISAIKAGEEQRKLDSESLSAGEKVIEIKAKILEAEKLINSGILEGKVLDEWKIVLAQRQSELRKDIANLTKEELELGKDEFQQFFDRVDLLQKYLGVEQNGAEERAEKQFLDQKAMRGLTEEESARLQVIELQGKARQTIIKMQSILELPVAEQSLAVNREKYAKLLEQLGVTKAQIAEKIKLVSVVSGPQLTSEQAVTAELQKQLVLKEKQGQMGILASMAMGGVTQEQVSRATDAELRAMIAVKQNELANYNSSEYKRMASVTGIPEALGRLSLENPIALAQAELSKRSNLRSITEAGGITAGAAAYQSQYGGNALMFESFYNSIKQNKTATDTTNNLLKSLSSQLAASGIFPSAPFGG